MMEAFQVKDLEGDCLGKRLRPNISLGASPCSLKPTSLATMDALSCMRSMSVGSLHSLRHSCTLLCFDFTSMPHLRYSASLSFVEYFFSNLLLSISLSRFNDFILHDEFESLMLVKCLHNIILIGKGKRVAGVGTLRPDLIAVHPLLLHALSCLEMKAS